MWGLSAVMRCHWCIWRACSPGHRCVFPETRWWPSASEPPPTPSLATEATAREKIRTKERKKERKEEEGQMRKETEERRTLRIGYRITKKKRKDKKHYLNPGI